MAGTEKRQHPRQPVFLDCEIDGASDFATMRISNLSLAGCYVDTGMSVGVGAAVRLRLVLAGTPLTLSGLVIHVQPGIGFGMRFDPLPEETLAPLIAFLRPPPERP